MQWQLKREGLRYEKWNVDQLQNPSEKVEMIK